MATAQPVPIRYLEISGRWDVDDAELIDALDKAYETLRPNLISITEVAFKRAALKRWAKANDFDLYHPRGVEKAENAVLVRAPLRFGRKGTHRLTETGPNPDRPNPLYATKVNLRQPGSGFKVKAAFAHTPAHVDRPRGLANTLGGRVHRAATWAMGRIGIKSPDIGRLLGGDWNLSIRQAWAERYLRKQTGLPSTFDLENLPDRGTHGKRIIDGARSNLMVIRPSKIFVYKGGTKAGGELDHEFVFTVLGWQLAKG